jgi:hypothetical protein
MFRYLYLPIDTPVLIPKKLTKFKCLILIEREVGDRYRNDVSDVLVEAGCLYSMAWGIDCTLWDDSVDYACIRYHGVVPLDDKFVMTTWHDDETLQETVEFAKHCTEYSDVKLDDILVLDFSNQEREVFIEKLYQQA